MAVSTCDHCGAVIADSGTMINHGGLVYCCANCAGAVEQEGSGSDPHAARWENELHCVHCGTAITDETTMVSRADDAFCCENCLKMAA